MAAGCDTGSGGGGCGCAWGGKKELRWGVGDNAITGCEGLIKTFNAITGCEGLIKTFTIFKVFSNKIFNFHQFLQNIGLDYANRQAVVVSVSFIILFREINLDSRHIRYRQVRYRIKTFEMVLSTYDFGSNIACTISYVRCYVRYCKCGSVRCTISYV